MPAADHQHELELTIQTFDKCAQQYCDKFESYKPYIESYEKFAALFTPRHRRVLEAACGPGLSCRLLWQQIPKLDIKGFDLAPAMVNLARANCPDAQFAVMDCRDLDQLDGRFDAIIGAFCFPYLNQDEVIEFIGAAAVKLSAGGLLFISTMEGRYENSQFKSRGEDEGVLNYLYSESFISTTLVEQGFEVLDLFRQDYPLDNAEADTDLFVFARKMAGD